MRYAINTTPNISKDDDVSTYQMFNEIFSVAKEISHKYKKKSVRKAAMIGVVLNFFYNECESIEEFDSCVCSLNIVCEDMMKCNKLW